MRVSAPRSWDEVRLLWNRNGIAADMDAAEAVISAWWGGLEPDGEVSSGVSSGGLDRLRLRIAVEIAMARTKA